jgi:hypothetical protein
VWCGTGKPFPKTVMFNQMQTSRARFSCFSCTMKIANYNKEQRREARARVVIAGVVFVCTYWLHHMFPLQQSSEAVGSFLSCLCPFLLICSNRVFPLLGLSYSFSYWE